MNNIKKMNVVMIGIGHNHASGVMQELLRNSQFHVLGYVEMNDAIWQKKHLTEPFNKLERLNESDVLNGAYNIDGIFIETEMSDLVPCAIKYLSLGVAIHMDKPTGTNDDFLSLLNIAQQHDIPIQLGYMYRYNPAIQIALKYIRENKIGDICYINAFMDTELSESMRNDLNPYTGGIVYVYGCHMLDIILRIMGEPNNIYPFIKQSKFGRSVDAYDSGVVLLEYDRGCSIIRTTGVDANGYHRRQIVISGSKGSIEIKPMENPTKMYYTMRNGQREYEDKAVEISLKEYDMNRRYLYMIEDFARLINKDVNHMIIPMDYEYERKLHEILLKVIHKGEVK